MANKSFFGKLASKNKKTAYEISKDTGIPEEKVKEVITGDRELPSAYVDKFVKATKSEDSKTKFRIIEALDYFMKVDDMEKLIASFNYPTQLALAEAAGVDGPYISRLKQRDFDKISKVALLKLYDFFLDDINKYVDSGAKVKSVKSSAKVKSTKSKNPAVINLSGVVSETPVYKKETKSSSSKIMVTSFDSEDEFNKLLNCSFKDVLTLYHMLDEYLNAYTKR